MSHMSNRTTHVRDSCHRRNRFAHPNLQTNVAYRPAANAHEMRHDTNHAYASSYAYPCPTMSRNAPCFGVGTHIVILLVPLNAPETASDQCRPATFIHIPQSLDAATSFSIARPTASRPSRLRG